MSDENSEPGKTHLGADEEGLKWDWWGENPVEIVLVAFILIFFFTLPRMGCGIDKTETPTQAETDAAEVTQNAG